MVHIINSFASEKENTTRFCKGKLQQAMKLLQKGGCIETLLSSCCIPVPLLIFALLAKVFQLFGLDGARVKYILPQVVPAMLCEGPTLISLATSCFLSRKAFLFCFPTQKSWLNCFYI